MKKQQLDQRGFGHAVLLVGILFVVIIGAAGYRVMTTRNDAKTDTNTKTTSQAATPEAETKPEWPIDPKITWTATGQGGWITLPYDAKPPECPEPLKMDVPTDVSKATSVLYPGQTRTGVFEGKGGNYKPHGGFRFDKSTDNKIDVVMPFNGSVMRGSRHTADGEIQYGFDIVNACGVMIRLGHLRDLTPAFQAIADKFPAAIEGDSRSTKVEPMVQFKTGDKIATAVGFKVIKNVGFDFGVYDLRKDNEASKNATYKAAHADTAELTSHALCWFDVLSAKDKTAVKALPAGEGNNGTKSDYCK